MFFKPNIRLIRAISITGIFVLSFFYLLTGYQFSLEEGRFDEGLAVYGATRILSGDIPYKDFWTLYAPGQFYFLAGIFRLFGTSVVTERMTTVAVEALLACLAYLVARKFTSSKAALTVWLLTLAWLRVKMPYSCPMTTALLFCMPACLGISNFIFTQRLKWLVLSGIFAGITTLFRQDIGAYLCISTSVTILALISSGSGTDNKGLLSRVKESIAANAAYYSGVAVIIAPLVFYFISERAFSDLISNTVVFPIKTYPAVRHLPFPALKANTAVFYLPLLIFLMAVIHLVFHGKRGGAKRQKEWFVLFCLILGIGFFNYTRVRSDIRHLLPTMIPAIMLFGLLLSGFTDNLGHRRKSAVKAMVNIAALILLVVSVAPKAKILFLHMREPAAELRLPRARGCYDETGASQDQQAAIQYIRDRTDPGERIFVGNLRHDRIGDNDIMFYFLSERHSATRYHELHPGLATTKKIQERIISQIKKSDTRYIVRWTGDENRIEPNKSNVSSGITELDDFIRRYFKTVKRFDSYVILYRGRDFS